ncbi:MAG: diaminopimelate epimerase [Chloroflexota bacterium]
MQFSKMQGAGNDFVLVETGETESDWSQLAIAMCDRHYGIGADGLLLVVPSRVADFRMRIFNTDGSEAEACGNGLRCVVKYVVDQGLVKAGVKEVSIETLAGVRKAQFFKVNGKVAKVRAGMGKPSLGNGAGKPADIKSTMSQSLTVAGKKLELGLVSMGNPHAVYFSPEPVADFPLLELGPKIETHKIFPKGVNFEVARVVKRGRIEARVWEKGVGETLACGSGASAITVAARLNKYIDNKAEIKLPGGTLEVEWDGTGEVFLSGPAETVFTGEWPESHR